MSNDDDKVAPRPRASSPPPPPSPQNEEDLAGAHQWSDDEAEHLDPSNKGKGKARELYPDDEDPDGAQEYPPVNDDEAETRRVEETLKRWEVAERMKRKSARESTLGPQAPTLFENVTRRASLLWSGRSAQNPHNINPSLGTHTALNTQDSADVVPLDDVAVTPTPSPTLSEPSNPFTNPDPFSDAEAVMSPSADPPPPTPQLEKEDATVMTPTTPRRPALLAASSSIRRPPTPKPLGLPPPRVPPPPLPQNSPPPVPVPDEEEPKETRWWHDWLCGFGEGSDRGGDHQSGRTNPFE